MKLAQNVCLDNISNEFEIWSCGTQNEVRSDNSFHTKGHNFSQSFLKLNKNVCLGDLQVMLKYESSRPWHRKVLKILDVIIMFLLFVRNDKSQECNSFLTPKSSSFF